VPTNTTKLQKLTQPLLRVFVHSPARAAPAPADVTRVFRMILPPPPAPPKRGESIMSPPDSPSNTSTPPRYFTLGRHSSNVLPSSIAATPEPGGDCIRTSSGDSVATLNSSIQDPPMDVETAAAVAAAANCRAAAAGAYTRPLFRST